MSNGDGPDGAPQIAVNGDAAIPSPTSVQSYAPKPPPLLMMPTPPVLPPVYPAYPPPGAPIRWVWERRQLVVPVSVELPCRCVRCGQPGAKRYYLILYWMKPQWYLLILVGMFGGWLIFPNVQKKGVVGAWLCEKHERRRERAFYLGWALGGLSGSVLLGTIVGWMLLDPGRRWTSVFGFTGGGLMMLLAVLVGYLYTRVVRATKIDSHQMWLKGISPEALR